MKTSQVGCGRSQGEAVSILTDIADAVVAALNDAQLSQAFTAGRHYGSAPVDIRDLEAVAVSVAMVGVEPNHEFSRRGSASETRIAIRIRARVASDSDADRLMLLAEEISDLFNTPKLEGYPSAECVGIENAPIFDPRKIDEAGIYSTAIVLTYSTSKATVA